MAPMVGVRTTVLWNNTRPPRQAEAPNAQLVATLEERLETLELELLQAREKQAAVEQATLRHEGCASSHPSAGKAQAVWPSILGGAA